MYFYMGGEVLQQRFWSFSIWHDCWC